MAHSRRLRGLVGAAIVDLDGFDHVRVGGRSPKFDRVLSSVETFSTRDEVPERITIYYSGTVVLAAVKDGYVAALEIDRKSPDLKNAASALLQDFQGFLREKGV